MSTLSSRLQAESLKRMAVRAPYTRKLGAFVCRVLPKVYQGGSDTELFCEVLTPKKRARVWDVGTGTGLIALHGKRNGAGYVLATDLNPAALKNAKENSRFLGLPLDVRRADVFGNMKGKFDVITFNPPFTDRAARHPHDIAFWDKNHRALRAFLRGIRSRLAPGGTALVGWSSFGNVRTLARLAREYAIGLQEVGRKKGKNNFTYYVFRLVL